MFHTAYFTEYYIFSLEGLVLAEKLLQVKNLKTHFFTKEGVVKAVDGVDFDVEKGQTLGIVGESGSGKTITVMSLLRLIPQPPGKIVDGEVLFKGEDLLKKTEKQMRKIRGNEISMIFQDPMTSLNPVMTVGQQIIEAVTYHQKVTKKKARKKAIEALGLVGIPEPSQRVDDYPHQFSGGMRQRAMIAMALACNPELLIADEPTTALDVTIQAQILELMQKLQSDLGTSILLITHDLGVVAESCHQVLVMYAGNPVEKADVESIFEKPRHPYTLGLLHSLPKLGEEQRERLRPIEGNPPNLSSLPDGCNFAPRCDRAEEICLKSEPRVKEVEPGHWVSCHCL
ncbi:ABC transporter ATP-binding protein [Metallumcola ferriviriculae]|uniref:ABC transporter ATP-binding protein n=1 Tax=Metallumcola ferriviriculae TaxID=3039180 RepID=A0AAU0URM8_9FIRM|nr:ABC transporter ATP-binding protein [Desulfitibacteraceae bacterium MK1]